MIQHRDAVRSHACDLMGALHAKWCNCGKMGHTNRCTAVIYFTKIDPAHAAIEPHEEKQESPSWHGWPLDRWEQQARCTHTHTETRTSSSSSSSASSSSSSSSSVLVRVFMAGVAGGGGGGGHGWVESAASVPFGPDFARSQQLFTTSRQAGLLKRTSSQRALMRALLGRSRQ